MPQLATASDFETFYAKPDPWGLRRVKFRDRALRRVTEKYTVGRLVTELGCGEGHLSWHVFGRALFLHGVDISRKAIDRAKARGIINMQFEVGDIRTSYGIPELGLTDVIVAIECLFYMTPEERAAVYSRIARDHHGIFIVSAPIIGGEYPTHESIVAELQKAGMKLLSWHNVFPHAVGPAARLVRSFFLRVPLAHWLLPQLPRSMVYQRVYICGCGAD